MKTILFHINYLLAGGIEKVLIEVLNGLDPNKYNIHLSIAQHLGELEILRDKIPAYVQVTYLIENRLLTLTRKKKIASRLNPFEKIAESLILPPFKKRLQKINLRKLLDEVDVVVDYDMTLAGYTDVLKGHKKIAYCHFSLANYWDGKKTKLDKLANRLNRYDKVIMLCDEMKAEAAGMYPFLEKKLERLYNAVDMANIRRQSAEALPGNIPVEPGKYFVSVGRLDERQKDTTTLIKAYAQYVSKYGSNNKLLIVGDGPSRSALEQLAQKEGVAGMVVFTGFDTNPYKWIINSRLLLFSSHYEGLPTVLIEALCLDATIIATACPTGVTELLMNGKAGMLIKPGDIAAMCEQMHYVLQHEAVQQSFHENARIILPQFEIGNMIRTLENMLF